MDIEHILTSLENENNESIMKLTSAKISKHKNDILQKLQLERNELKEMNKVKNSIMYFFAILILIVACVQALKLSNKNKATGQSQLEYI